MNHLGMAYQMKNRASKMAKGGQMCAHGGPIHCAMGCYSEGGVVTDDHSEPMVEREEHHSEMPKVMNEPKSFKGAGLMHPKHMVKAIMMAKGGMVDSEDAWDKGEEHEPMGDYSMSDDEAMPLDHATEMDDRLTPADSESEDEFMGMKKKDLISRVMMKRR